MVELSCCFCPYCAIYMKTWLCFAYRGIFPESFEFCLIALSGKSVRINSGLAKRELLPRQSALHSMLIQVSAFKLRQRRKYLRQYVLRQIKFYSLAQTHFFAIAMSVSGIRDSFLFRSFDFCAAEIINSLSIAFL